MILILHRVYCTGTTDVPVPCTQVRWVQRRQRQTPGRQSLTCTRETFGYRINQGGHRRDIRRESQGTSEAPELFKEGTTRAPAIIPKAPQINTGYMGKSTERVRQGTAETFVVCSAGTRRTMVRAIAATIGVGAGLLLMFPSLPPRCEPG